MEAQNGITINFPVTWQDPQTGQRYLCESCLVPLFDKALTANQPLSDLSASFDPAYPTLLLGLAGVSTGAYKLNLQYPSGRWMSSSQIRAENIVGSGKIPSKLCAVRIPANGKVGLQITEVSGNANTVQLVAVCVRLIPL